MQGTESTPGWGAKLPHAAVQLDSCSAAPEPVHKQDIKKKKMDGDLNRHQRHTANQQTHAKMLNINNHQENATQNHKENFPGAEAVKTLHSQ